MKLQGFSHTLSLISFLLPLSDAFPARRAEESGNNPDLRGSKTLMGYSPSEKVGSTTTPDIKYSLLPGQKNDPDIGTWLDFTKADNPQPIRGDHGGDDPGPRKILTSYVDTRHLYFLRKLRLR